MFCLNFSIRRGVAAVVVAIAQSNGILGLLLDYLLLAYHAAPAQIAGSCVVCCGIAVMAAASIKRRQAPATSPVVGPVTEDED